MSDWMCLAQAESRLNTAYLNMTVTPNDWGLFAGKELLVCKQRRHRFLPDLLAFWKHILDRIEGAVRRKDPPHRR